MRRLWLQTDVLDTTTLPETRHLPPVIAGPSASRRRGHCEFYDVSAVRELRFDDAMIEAIQMNAGRRLRRALLWSAGAVGAATAAYAGYVADAWWRYGHPPAPAADDTDPLLERFMPVYEVAERRHTRAAAPAEITFAAACEQDLIALPIVRAIFKMRELVLDADPDSAIHPRGLLAMTKSIGWGVLAEVPGREVVMGAVTQPWCGNVVFRRLPPDEFAAFDEPDHVKIAWTLRADRSDPHECIFRTETRVLTTDAAARAKFRWYWSRFSPGIKLIRLISLAALRRDAERRAGRFSFPGRPERQPRAPHR